MAQLWGSLHGTKSKSENLLYFCSLLNFFRNEKLKYDSFQDMLFIKATVFIYKMGKGIYMLHLINNVALSQLLSLKIDMKKM
jgi:hypothetical protein